MLQCSDSPLESSSHPSRIKFRAAPVSLSFFHGQDNHCLGKTNPTTVMCHTRTRIRSEKCTVGGSSPHECQTARAQITELGGRAYNQLGSRAWPLLLGCRPAQRVIVLNTVSNCNTIAGFCVSKHTKT